MNIKPSFFDRLSGNTAPGDALDSFDEELPITPVPPHKGSNVRANHAASRPASLDDDAGSEGQLPVDVHQTAGDIVIRAFVAGVRPDELNISISRDMVEIEGSRMEREQVAGPDYFTRELFWGSFSRTIMLPKLDKAKQTKLRVKAG